ncbi:MAG TPA: FtsX-like permease family protein [Trueperaceae bacterium]|nr:FtsX-like permease family protein [Trueperaceae bacterium]
MLALAWRNLWRQRRRSLTALGAVALVVAFSVVYYGIGGAAGNSMYSQLTGSSGQVQVHAAGYRDTRDFSAGLIRDAGGVRATIAAHARGGQVVGVLDVPALLIHGDRSRALALDGRDWPAPVRRDYLQGNRLEGRFLTADDGESVVLGRSLARALDVGIGDQVQVYAPGTEGFGAASFTVSGLLDVADPAAQARTALVSLSAAQALAAPDAVTRFEIHYPDIKRVVDDGVSTRVAGALTPLLPRLQVETWRQVSPGLVKLLHAFGPMLAVITLIFYVLAGLLVVNTIYLGLIERVREFGVLVSLGMTGRRLMGLITLESVLLCATGAAAGALVGTGAVAWLGRGFTIPGFQQYIASFGMDPMFYPSVGTGQVAQAVAFALATGVLAALWPASLAARLQPAEAMRFAA